MLTLEVVLLLAGCAGSGSSGNTISAGIPPSGTPPPPSIPQFSHVVIVLEENHSYSQVIGNSAMPYLNQLAHTYAVSTQYFANAHPSLPNYFMMTTGQLITLDNKFPGPVPDDNIVRELVAAGQSWRAYADSLPAVGYIGGDKYPYVKHHNPFPYFTDVIGSPQAANIVPVSQLTADLAAGQLPNFAFIIPNLLHDAHDCPSVAASCPDNDKLAAADAWLKANIDPLLNDPGFQKSGLLIVTFDEGVQSDTAGGGGHIATVIAGTGVKKGFQSITSHDHAALLRLTLRALGITTLPGAASVAADMGEFF
jgi:phosphatidylinositol-3-phosphatase